MKGQHFLARWKKFVLVSYFFSGEINLKPRFRVAHITSRNHYTTQELLLLSIRLQSCSFYNHLLFDRIDSWFRAKRPSIVTTFDRNDLLPMNCT